MTSSASKKESSLIAACVRNPALLDQVSQSIVEELVDEVALGVAFEIHRSHFKRLSEKYVLVIFWLNLKTFIRQF